MDLADELLSHWIMETGRSAVLSGRGHGESATRSAERARILASACSKEGVRIDARLASRHAEWLADISGSEQDTGTLGWFFLQRLGMFVDAHVAPLLHEAELARMKALSEPDEADVNAAIMRDGLPAPPPPQWPKADEAMAPGKPVARFGILGDAHIGMDFSNRIIPVAIDQMNGEKFDFTFVIGDLTQDGKQSSFEKAGEILSRFEPPLLLTLGNHDMWGGGDEPAGLRRFTEIFKTTPYGIQEVDGVRLIAINSAIAMPSPYPPFSFTAGAFTDEPNESVPGGGISDEMASWMEEIKLDGPTFIALHHPPYPYLGLPPIVFGLDQESTRTLSEFAKRINAQAIICGHTHRSAFYDLDGTTVIELPSTKEWPFGYAVVEVTDEGWSFNLKQVDAPELIEEGSRDANLIIRRYATGPEEARGYATKLI